MTDYPAEKITDLVAKTGRIDGMWSKEQIATHALTLAIALKALAAERDTVAEEPEWEYGVALAGGNPDGYIYRWPTLEAAEALAELNPAYKPSYYRRVKAGPWEPLPEGADQ